MSQMREWLPSDLMRVLSYYAYKAKSQGSQIPEQLEVFLRHYLGQFKNRLNAPQFAEIVEQIGIIQRVGSAQFNTRLYDVLNATLHRDYYRFSATELRSLVTGFSAIQLEASRERGLTKLKKLILDSKRDIDDQGKLDLLVCLLEDELDPLLDSDLQTFFFEYFQRRYKNLSTAQFLQFARAVLSMQNVEFPPLLAAQIAYYMRDMLGDTLQQSLDFYDLLLKLKGAIKDDSKNTPPEIFLSLKNTLTVYKRAILLHMSKSEQVPHSVIYKLCSLIEQGNLSTEGPFLEEILSYVDLQNIEQNLLSLIVNLGARYGLELKDLIQTRLQEAIVKEDNSLLDRLQLMVDFITMKWDYSSLLEPIKKEIKKALLEIQDQRRTEFGARVFLLNRISGGEILEDEEEFQLCGKLAHQKLKKESNILEILVQELKDQNMVHFLNRMSHPALIAIGTHHCLLQLWDEQPWPFQFQDGGQTPISKKIEGQMLNPRYATANVAHLQDVSRLLKQLNP